MCKACFDDCHPGHEAYDSGKTGNMYCDCFTVKCKFQAPNYIRDKRERQEVIKMRESLDTDKLEVTEEHR